MALLSMVTHETHQLYKHWRHTDCAMRAACTQLPQQQLWVPFALKRLVLLYYWHIGGNWRDCCRCHERHQLVFSQVKWKRCSGPDDVSKCSVCERSARLNSSLYCQLCVLVPCPCSKWRRFFTFLLGSSRQLGVENLSVGPREPFVCTLHSFVSTRIQKAPVKRLLPLYFCRKCTLCSLYIVLLPTCCRYYGLSQGACRALCGSQTVKCDAVTQYRASEGTGADSVRWNPSFSRWKQKRTLNFWNQKEELDGSVGIFQSLQASGHMIHAVQTSLPTDLQR